MIILKTYKRIVTIYEQKIFTNKELKRRKETVTFLMPAPLTEVVSFHRGEAYPRGLEYQFIELARGQQVKVENLDCLEKYIHEQNIIL